MPTSVKWWYSLMNLQHFSCDPEFTAFFLWPIYLSLVLIMTSRIWECEASIFKCRVITSINENQRYWFQTKISPVKKYSWSHRLWLRRPVKETLYYISCLVEFARYHMETCGSWWRHQMETFSALLALCTGNSPVPGEFLSQRPVTRSLNVFFDLRLNKRLSKQSWGWWFETP